MLVLFFAVISNVLSPHGRCEGDSFDSRSLLWTRLRDAVEVIFSLEKFWHLVFFFLLILLKVFLSNLWRRRNAMAGA